MTIETLSRSTVTTVTGHPMISQKLCDSDLPNERENAPQIPLVAPLQWGFVGTVVR
jgi:hypothetical protein